MRGRKEGLRERKMCVLAECGGGRGRGKGKGRRKTGMRMECGGMTG